MTDVDLPTARPDDAMEDVAYLARSSNRVRILEALADGPSTRRELDEATSASGTTLGRILSEFEQRGWAERTPDGTYAATPVGRHVLAAFLPAVESVEAVRRLGEAVTWLPTDEMSIGLHHFSDAWVRRPERDDPADAVDYFVDLIRDTTEIGILSHMVPPVPIAEAIRDGVLTGELSATLVTTADCVDYFRTHPDRCARWREVLNAGGDVFRYEGEIPCNLFVFDETVLVKKSRPDPIQASYGVPIVSENPTVRSWASELIRAHRDDAEPLDAATFADEP